MSAKLELLLFEEYRLIDILENIKKSIVTKHPK